MSANRFCMRCGTALLSAASFCSNCGVNVKGTDDLGANAAMPAPASGNQSDETLIRQIADYEKLSGILWIGLGVIQVLTVIAVIAGIWNLYAGYTRIKAQPLILARHKSVPDSFESINGLVIIGLINLILGGVIGVLFVAFDYVIRDKVLSNKHLFVNG